MTPLIHEAILSSLGVREPSDHVVLPAVIDRLLI